MVRCKFVCNFVDQHNKTVYLSPVYTGSEENEQFFRYTPGGQIMFHALNPEAFAQFEQSKEYYIDFTKVE